MEVELHDGTILEFPDGTNPAVIQGVVKKMLASRQPNDVPPAGDMSQWQQTPEGLPPSRPTFGEDLAGGAKATLKGAVKGATAIPGMLADAPFQIANMFGAEQQLPSQAQSAMLDQVLGDTSGYQSVENIANAATGAAVPAAMAGRAAQGASAAVAPYLKSIAAAPGAQITAGVTGEGSRQIAESAGAGPVGQTAAALIGGVGGVMVPQLAGDALSKAGKVVYHAGIEPHFAAGREAIKGRAYLDAGGDRVDDIATALRNYVPKVKGSEMTAGEAAAGAGSAEFSAMQNSAEGVLPSEYVARGKARDAARLATVRSVGQDKQALADAVRARRAQTAPLYDESDAQMIEDNPALRETLDKVPGAITSRARRLARTRGEEFSIGETRPAMEEPTGLLDASGKPYTRTTEATAETFPGRSLSYLQKSIGAHIKDPSKGISSHERQALSSLSDEVGGHLGEPYAAAEDLYKGLSEPVNQMRIGQFLEGKLTNSLDEDAPQRAASYATALRDAPATVRSKLSGTRLEKLTEALTPDQVRAVESVRDDLASMAEQQRLARAGSRSGKNVMQTFTNSIDATGHSGQLPNLLSRPAMAFNFVMRRLKGQMDERLAREIAQEMLDPKATGVAIERAIERRGDPKMAAALRYRRAAQASAQGALTGATGTIGE